MSKFERLFSARAIAVVGATPDEYRVGGQPVRALRENGYRGKVFPVNPKYPEIGGYRCYPSLAAIGEPVDVVVICVPAAATPAVVKECGVLGIPYAVVLGGGFRESGPAGAALQDEMVANARAGGVRVIGPNCLGVANVHERVFAAFGSLTRPPLLNPGPVSMVMQSGGFGNTLAFRCHAAGIGFRILVTSGNEADLTAPELIDALVDDPQTRVIFSYLEGVTDGRALMAVAKRALAAGKPLLLWKGGNAGQGARVAASHTANLTGTYDVWRAAFRQCGIIEVRDTEQAADAIRALLPGRYPRGRNVAVITPSGGSAVAFTDVADERGLTLVSPAEATTAILRTELVGAASIENPIDLAASFIGDANRERYLRAARALLADPGIDQLCCVSATLIGKGAAINAGVLTEAAKETTKPLLAFSAVPREVAEDAFGMFDRAGIPIFVSPTRMAHAAATLADYGDARRRSEAAAVLPEMLVPPLPATTGTLGEADSKAILAACGVRVSRDVVLAPGDDSAITRLDLRFPVAVKILSAEIAHKTDIGGVMLNVADAAHLHTAVAAVVANARKAHPAAPIDGVLVSEMITGAVETIAGVVNDEVFGPVVVLGMGGIAAEAMRDTSYRIAPFDTTTAREMIGELRARRIFDGLRGRPPCDVDALADALAKISQLAWAARDRLAELDVNPLMVLPRGEGVVAADALAVLR